MTRSHLVATEPQWSALRLRMLLLHPHHQPKMMVWCRPRQHKARRVHVLEVDSYSYALISCLEAMPSWCLTNCYFSTAPKSSFTPGRWLILGTTCPQITYLFAKFMFTID